LSTPAQVVETALRALCGPPGADADGIVSDAVVSALGGVIEAAVLSKTLCLLAGAVHAAPPDGLPRPAARFFAGLLRTNRHKTAVYRAEALALTAGLRAAGVPAAVLGGLSVADIHYRPGHRQFSDLDLLIAADHAAAAAKLLRGRGYDQPGSTTAWRRDLADPLVPRLIVDLSTTLAHTRCADAVAAVLGRRVEVRPPNSTSPPGPRGPRGLALPVLSPGDALEHTLVRLATPSPQRAPHPAARLRWALAADALRLHHAGAALPTTSTAAEDAQRGWSILRRVWPHLPRDLSTAKPATPETS
jgi:hypothetical protein